MGVGAKIGNNNAEKWTIKEARNIFDIANAICKDKEDYIISGNKIKGFKYHFLGEIASELNIYLDLFTYLRDKFEELKPIYNTIKTKLEANCFSDSKKGIIKEASAIMNLKSNYGWTDRVNQDHTTKGKEIGYTPLSFFKSDDKD